MIPIEQNLTMTQGDTYIFGLKINLDKQPDNIIFSCSNNYSGDYIFQKHFDDGIILEEIIDDRFDYDNFDIYDSSNYKCYSYLVKITPDDTKNIAISEYLYDLQVLINNDVFTLMKGLFTILPEVTI